jgi:hypothetical protein
VPRHALVRYDVFGGAQKCAARAQLLRALERNCCASFGGVLARGRARPSALARRLRLLSFHFFLAFLFCFFCFFFFFCFLAFFVLQKQKTPAGEV